MKPGAPLAFTYHHNKQEAYLAAGMAILDAGLTCSASLPCPAEMGGSIHIHGTGSSIVDTVFVCRDRGVTPRALLFEDAPQLAEIMTRELVRPASCGHEAHGRRHPLHRLSGTSPAWRYGTCATSGTPRQPTEKKLAIIRAAMNAIATVDDVKAMLEWRIRLATGHRGRSLRPTRSQGTT